MFCQAEEPILFPNINSQDTLVKDKDPSQLNRGIWDFQKYLKLNFKGAGAIYVNTVFGSLTLSRTDVNYPSGYFPINISFTYNSGSTFIGRFGSGWTMNYNMRYIENRQNKNIIIAGADDKTSLFVFNSNGSFTGRNGVTDSLIKLEQGYKLKVWKDKANNNGDYSEYYFDSPSHPYPTHIIDRNQNRIQFHYNQLNELESIEFPGRKKFVFMYSNNKLTSILNNEKMLVNYYYNDYGDLEKVLYADGRYIKYNYETECGKLSSIENSFGGIVNFSYNNDQTISIIDFPQDTATYTFTYHFDNNSTGLKDPRGYLRKYHYDSLYRVDEEIDPVGNSKSYVWSNYLLKEIKENDKPTHLYDYDFRGNIVKEEFYENAKNYSWNYTFNKLIKNESESDDVEYLIDDKGNVTQINSKTGVRILTNDEKGKLTSYYLNEAEHYDYLYNEQGLISQIKKNGMSTIFIGYDINGNINIISNGDIRHEFVYNDNNKLIQYKNPLGGIRNFEYDKIGNLANINYENKASEYFIPDVYGRLIHHITRDNDTVHYTYDKVSNIIKTGFDDQTSYLIDYNPKNLVEKIIDPQGEYYGLSYDDNNNVISIRNRINRTSNYDYDKYGNLQSIKKPDGSLIQLRYNKEGKLAKKIIEDGSAYVYTYTPSGSLASIDVNNQYSYSFKYDRDNLLSNIKIKDDEWILKRYDNILKIIDDKGLLYQINLDSNKNVKEFINPKGLKYTFTYKNGLLKTVENKINLLQKYDYDQAGNISNFQIGIDFDFKYDNYGRISSILYPNNSTKIFKYDNRGYISEFTNRIGNVYKFLYSKPGYLTSILTPTGSSYTYSYDAEGNLTTASNIYDNRLIINYLDDKIIKISDALKREINFGYNKKQNIINLLIGTGISVDFIRDGLNRITSIRPPESGSYSFAYKDFEINSIIDPYQQKTTITAGKYGLEKILYPNGDSLVYSYLNDGYIRIKKDQSGLLTTYSYDELFRLKNITNNLGYKISYDYDYNNNLILKYNEVGGKYAYTRDNMNNIIKINIPSGINIDLEYNNENCLVALKDWSSLDYKLYWDEQLRLKAIRNKLSFEYSRSFDLAENVTAINNPNGYNINLSYDDSGKLIFMKNPKGELTSYKYDPAGNLNSIVYPERNNISFNYNKNDRLSIVRLLPTESLSFSYDNNGKLITRTDPKGQSYTFKRNNLGQISQIIDPSENNVNIYYKNGLISGISDEEGNIYTYERDLLGRRIAKTDPEKLVIINNYYSNGKLYNLISYGIDTTQFEYDILGLLTKKTNGRTTEEYIHDYSGNILIYGNNNLKSEMIYDFEGNITTVSTKGKILNLRYDPNHNVNYILINNSIPLEIIYDKNNLISSLKSPFYTSFDLFRNKNDKILNIKTDSSEFKISRDILDRIKSLSDNRSSSLSYDFYYDVSSNISRIKNPNDSIITNYYNGNILTGTSTTNGLTEFRYSRNKLLKEAKISNVSERFIYNNSNYINSIRYYTNDGSFNHGVEFTYKNNNINSIAHSLSGKAYTEYKDNQLISYGRNKRIILEYNSLGKISSIKYPNGIYETRSYNGNGEISMSTLFSPFDSVIYSYEIEYLDNKINIRGTDSCVINFDNAGRIEHILEKNKNTQLSFDNYGNRINVTNDSIVKYNYENGRLVQAEGYIFEYDRAGNITKMKNDISETIYIYDNLNRLIEAKLPNSKVVKYYYDATGYLFKILYDSSFKNIMDSDHLTNTEINQNIGIIFEANDKGSTRENYYFYDSTLKMKNVFSYFDTQNESERFVHYDYAGRAKFISDEEGNIQLYNELDIYGSCIEATKFAYQYKGMLYDSLTGLYYDGKRFYDPKIGRYINKGMNFIKDNINPYVFSENNPITSIKTLNSSYDLPKYEITAPYQLDYTQPFLKGIPNKSTNQLFDEYLNYYKQRLFSNFENYGIVVDVDYEPEDLYFIKTVSSVNVPQIFNYNNNRYENILPDSFEKRIVTKGMITATPAFPQEMEIEFNIDEITSAIKLDYFQILHDYNYVTGFDIKRPASMICSGIIEPRISEVKTTEVFVPKTETNFENFIEIGNNIEIPNSPDGVIKMNARQKSKYRKTRKSDISLNDILLEKENVINQNILNLYDLKNILYTSSELGDGYLEELDKILSPIKNIKELNEKNRYAINKQYLIPNAEDAIPGLSDYEEEDPLTEISLRKRPILDQCIIEKKIEIIKPDGNIFNYKNK